MRIPIYGARLALIADGVTSPTTVVPAQAGTQILSGDVVRAESLDPSLRWDDGGMGQ
ncbi:hypothetical protein GCM10017655_14650 [Pseudomonas turukhanskensis]|uniref:Uncharacterized protein n=1 Tax=Pseudomonas turukhanskensis TaxID=1806536 RepID=A0A9W6K7K5_9PSED|nr:hypothetical protein GCM10017655_14650 [Pseudomonas turukhanskensis]